MQSQFNSIARPLSRLMVGLTFLVMQSIIARAAGEQVYAQHNLVSDGAVPADHFDPKLVNAWGLAFNPNGVVWVNDNGSGFSTLYDGDGTTQALTVTIPPAPGSNDTGNPTGIVFNTTTDFRLTTSTTTAFIFASENGTIAAWSPAVDLTHAIVVSDLSSQGTIYKGLALGANGTGHFLYATDFHNGRIIALDKNFLITPLPGTFTDPHLPAGYAPFGIQNILGNLYVTYAKQDADAEDDVHGKGLGFVSVFDTNGNFIKRLVTRGQLNAPWGLALAPADFGKYSNCLLIGNFGDGTINAFDLDTGNNRGSFKGTDGKTLHIDGLWGLAFGNGLLNQPTNTLFFTAGPEDEQHGLYGKLTPAIRVKKK